LVISLEAGPVSLDGYTVDAHVEVVNRTVDPIHSYEPLNTKDALRVRPGDTLSFTLSCAIAPKNGNASISQLLLAVPGGLKIVEDPHLTTATEPDAKIIPVLDGLAWAWVLSDPLRNTAQASFTATVSTDKLTYLTATWGCPVSIPKQKIVPSVSRAVLKVEPN
jgi:hypothetical protein